MILIVDDSVIIRTVLHGICENLGYESDTAENGLVGLLKAKSGAYKIIFTDINMPEMDGVTMAKEILKETNPPKIIFISGSEKDKDSDINGVEYLMKPILAQDIMRILRENGVITNTFKPPAPIYDNSAKNTPKSIPCFKCEIKCKGMYHPDGDKNCPNK